MKLTLARAAEFMPATGNFDPNAVAGGYSIDSRTLQHGELFFAVRGERLDGHDYVEAALAAGAVGAVVEQEQVGRFASQSRLLVVEDEKSQQVSIEALLGYDDIDVSFADTGTEALAAVSNESYDCLVLDLRLPDMTGFEVLERLRDTPSLSELPVVVFTGKDL